MHRTSPATGLGSASLLYVRGCPSAATCNASPAGDWLRAEGHSEDRRARFRAGQANPPPAGRTGREGWRYLLPGSHFGFEVLHDRLEGLLGGHPRLIGSDQQCQVLGHLAALDRVDADLLERFGKAHDIGRVVEPAAIDQAAGPGEDAGDRVGAGRLALLVLAVVT